MSRGGNVFTIELFKRISKGNYRVVLTTDDPGFLPTLRLLRHISSAAYLLDERIDRERRILRLTDARLEAAPAQRAERARILATYRELPGPRAKRLKLLRSILKDQYPRIGYDDVLAVISLGVSEERAVRRSRSRELAAGGRSAREIGSILHISKAQAARLSVPRRGELPGCPTIDDLPSPVYQRAVSFGAYSRREKSQEETGTPEGGATALFGGAAVRGR
jgi:hypothetical protein